MILHHIEVRYVGPFREVVSVGEFQPGLNVLAADNESGKSTIIHAAARGLFDRHGTKDGEIKALQPAGTSLSPRIVVDFTTGQGRFRVSKTFLNKADSLLERHESGAWKALADADAADTRVRELLQSTLPGRGSTTPAHWGLLSFLWARQGELAEWPRLHEGAGQHLSRRLARVEINPALEKLRAYLREVASRSYTPTGQAAERGRLFAAEKELSLIDKELGEIRAQMARLEETRKDYLREQERETRLEPELAQLRASAAQLAAAAKGAEDALKEFRRREEELKQAARLLDQVQADVRDAATLRQEQTLVLAELEPLAPALETLGTQLRTLQEKDLELRVHRKTLTDRVTQLRAWQERAERLARQSRLAAELTELTAFQEDIEKDQSAQRAREEDLAALPEITEVELRKLEKLDRDVLELGARSRALGLTAELRPDRDGMIREGSGAPRPVQAGAPLELASPDELDLWLEGWGRVRVRSGGLAEARDTAARGEEARRQLAEAFARLQSADLAAARALSQRRQALEAACLQGAKALAARLKDRKFASADALRKRLAELRRELAALGEHAALQEEEAAALATLPEVEREAAKIEAEREAVEETLANLRQREKKTQSGQAALQEKLAGLTGRAQALAARYLGSPEAALAEARVHFTQAEARLEEARRQLPAEAEKLPLRAQREQNAVAQVDGELREASRKVQHLLGQMRILGGDGLYGRETNLLERRTEAELTRQAAQREGLAARLAAELLDRNQNAATQTVLAPLEDELSAAFSQLTGEADRRVFLNEQLGIAGLGRAREETHDFANLSQGAKEQLLLCLRLAVARQLVENEPQVLILDDVLVNTDAGRQKRVLDVLQDAAAQLQIIILTCHPERFRGIGNLLTLKRS
jgi:DNA repair exonuclease SbcCD ATPase subunit